jgi:G3E family GTPase
MLNLRYILLSIAFCPLVAIAADKHVHGEAELFIAFEGNQVLIEFESPADNIIGFEHAPATQLQQQQLANSLVLLDEHSSIAAFSEASCKQISANVESPFKNNRELESDEKSHDSEHKKHDHDHDHDHEKNEKNEHTDFHTSYTLQCNADTQNINAVTINAFKHFTGINNITVKWVTANGQGSAKATAAKTEITLK